MASSDPTAAQTLATYDQLGRRITSTVVERVPQPTRNLTTRYRYDALGNRTGITTPTGAATTATYDDLGHQLTVTNPLGKTASSSYDGAGRTSTVTDPLGAKTTAGYDQAGRLTSQSDVDPTGAVLRTRGFGYDGAGNHTTATDPLGVTTTRVFDAANRLTASTFPDLASAKLAATSNLNENWGAVQWWLRNGTSNRMTINGDMPSGASGRVYLKGSQTFVPARGVATVLERNASMPGGFLIFTNFATL